MVMPDIIPLPPATAEKLADAIRFELPAPLRDSAEGVAAYLLWLAANEFPLDSRMYREYEHYMALQYELSGAGAGGRWQYDGPLIAKYAPLVWVFPTVVANLLIVHDAADGATLLAFRNMPGLVAYAEPRGLWSGARWAEHLGLLSFEELVPVAQQNQSHAIWAYNRAVMDVLQDTVAMVGMRVETPYVNSDAAYYVDVWGHARLTIQESWHIATLTALMLIGRIDVAQTWTGDRSAVESQHKLYEALPAMMLHEYRDASGPASEEVLRGRAIARQRRMFVEFMGQ